MRVLDLFAGLRGWSAPFADRGHEVFSIDLDPRFDVSLHADIESMTPADLPWRPDIILASPPCEKFSVMAFGANWLPGYVPRPQAVEAIRLVQATLDLIADLAPAFWVMENPVGLLRKMPMMASWDHRTVWYCRYGERRAKPTDLWGAFPPSFVTRPTCHNGNPDHNAAPRGSRTGTQGFGTYADRSKIPAELALDVCLAAERDLADGALPVPTSIWAVA